VVENLLLLARADSGQADLRRVPVDLARIVEEACVQSKPLAQAHGLSVTVSISDRPMDLKGDAQALRRLLLILIDNAVKFTPEGGKIEVKLKAEKTAAVVTVHDTGCGIPAAELPLIFDRFYRVDKARARDRGGAGLGLAIARWIVSVHGGGVTAESRPGEGATFRVTFPLAEDDAAPQRIAGQNSSIHGGKS
jgi:signal transduction histidine kinase